MASCRCDTDFELSMASRRHRTWKGPLLMFLLPVFRPCRDSKTQQDVSILDDGSHEFPAQWKQ